MQVVENAGAMHVVIVVSRMMRRLKSDTAADQTVSVCITVTKKFVILPTPR